MSSSRVLTGAGRLAWAAVVITLLAVTLVLLRPTTGAGAPSGGFEDRAAISGLSQPTAVEFATGGTVFVAEKRGIVKVLDNLQDPTPKVFADLRGKVFNNWDRGLLGLALPPDFAADPWVYVLYTYNARIGGTAPLWPVTDPGNPDFDDCPTPPGFNTGGCVVSGRLARLRARPTTGPDGKPDGGYRLAGREQVLIEDWCQQFPSHSIGDLAFGPDGMLYVSGGDGSSYGLVDAGRLPDANHPPNPCRDPLDPDIKDANGPRSDEGGSFRSLDLRSPGDPVSLDGTIVRIDPDTGAPGTGNPLAGASSTNAARIVAMGLRNPFRIAFRPGTSELWLGDVGWETWEEINRIVDPVGRIDDFGWPCREGAAPQPGYKDYELCQAKPVAVRDRVADGLPTQAVDPWFTYNHQAPVADRDGCRTGGSSTTGVAFYDGGLYPAEYDGALFFADATRRCIWVAPRDGTGLPNRAAVRAFVTDASRPVDLTIGPAGDLFYVDLDGGIVHRVQHTAGNRPPVAAIRARPTAGKAPLTVRFDARRSTDPDGDTDLRYAWDLDGDGAFDDGTAARVSHTYAKGLHTARLRVTDSLGLTHDASIRIDANGGPPAAKITRPAISTRWKVGDRIAFAGTATDGEDGKLPAASLRWTLVLQHCDGGTDHCHEHQIGQYTGTSGSFVAPDHQYPSYLELRLAATDSQGLTVSRKLELQPRTTTMRFATSPAGLELTVNGTRQKAPFSRRVVVGSRNSLDAPASQTRNGHPSNFASWSDGQAAAHDVTAPAKKTTWTATYRAATASPRPGTTTTTTTTTTAPPAEPTTTRPAPAPSSTRPPTTPPPASAPGGGQGRLPFSGTAGALPLLVGGLTLLALGAAAVLGARRRRGT